MRNFSIKIKSNPLADNEGSYSTEKSIKKRLKRELVNWAE